MAPLPTHLEISGLDLSSPELDSRSSPLDLPAYLQSLSLADREALTNPTTANQLDKRDDTSILSPIYAHSLLTARSPATTQNQNPGAGSIPPDDFNNKGIQALFALIGAGFVLGSIWFFFWAKNGGFHFRKGDWEDYKSTVLRRKGPNGTTLSNATKSTRLGGGSVVGQGYSDCDGTETMTDMSSEAPVLKEKNNKKSKAKKETTKERVIREAKQAGWEGAHDDDVRAYRHEKVARVGGLNKDSDAMHYGTDYSETDPSVTSHYQQRSSNGGQRSRHSSPEKRDRLEQRDFSNGQDAGFNEPAEPKRPARYHSPSKNTPRSVRQVPSSYGYPEPSDVSDVQSQNTKSYHHPIPGLSGQGRGGGFRRGRGDELDD